MPVRLKVMFLSNVEISFVRYYGYLKEISISFLVCGAKLDDCRISKPLPMSTACKCQRMKGEDFFVGSSSPSDTIFFHISCIFIARIHFFIFILFFCFTRYV